MLLKSLKLTTLLLFLVLCVIQCEISVAYKTEVEITPAPSEESTTKKSGFFGGIKKWFGGSSQTTVDPIIDVTTAKPAASLPAQNPKTPALGGNNQKPPPLPISNAPLVPLGARPDTPSSSPFGAGPPQWPAVTSTSTAAPGSFEARPQGPHTNRAGGVLVTSTTLKPVNHPQGHQVHPVGGVVSSNTDSKSLNQQNTPQGGHHSHPVGGLASGNSNSKPFNQPNTHASGQPSVSPGFAPYYSPKSQPSGVDLSYGGAFNAGGHPQQGGKPGFGLAPINSIVTTSTSTTTTTARPQQIDFDLRGNFDSNKPSVLPASRKPSVKEDFPALPTPKSPSPTPSLPSSPSSWNKPLPTLDNSHSSSTTTVRSTLPKAPAASAHNVGNGGVAFVPHTGTTTTVRPGFEKEGNSLATDDEIRSLTETLYTKENSGQLNLITVNVQGKTRSIDSTDEATKPLLEVDPKAFDNPTVAKMRLLFNNYEQDTLVNEHVTPIERKEENDFVDAVMATNVMRQAMLFLQNKGIVTPDPKTHRDLVKELWFTQYSRGSGKIGSSGFEHVFANEVKNGTIIGLHNWVYFFDEENTGHLDYKGYLNQLDLGTKGKILKVRFTHNGLNKPVNTLFIGTSPELELALYTVCFKLRPDRTCPVSLGNNKFGIVTYSWRYRGKSLIGSAYPEI